MTTVELSERDKLRQELGVGSPMMFEWLNLLIYSKPGAGKTFFIGTAMDSIETRPLLILDIEGGAVTLRKRPDVDVVQLRSRDEVVFWHDKLLNQNDVLGYKTVAIDTGSELAKLDMREIMIVAHNENPQQHVDVPSPREWGIAGEHMRRIVRAYRDLPMNFIMTAHLDERTDDLNIMRIYPMFSGKLRIELAGFMDIVGLLHTTVEDEEIVRHLQVQPGPRSIAKDRTAALGDTIDNPTIPMLWQKIKES
jgi:phage nucleotide-binding protein